MEYRDGTGYELDYMPIMDLVWGKGFIAPGGEGNVDQIVAGVDLKGKRVLELGSGAGGGALVLAGKYGASVVGLELEQPLVDLSTQYAKEAGIEDKVEFRCVEPGPLPVEDGSFDALYSSGVILHIEDRFSLFQDILRILKPGGMLLGYDWFPTILSDDINVWLNAADLHAFPDTVENYAVVLAKAGFTNVNYSDASAWYLNKAEKEMKELEGPLFDKAAKVSSEKLRDMVLNEWQKMNVVLKSGELKSGYFRGAKPG